MFSHSSEVHVCSWLACDDYEEEKEEEKETKELPNTNNDDILIWALLNFQDQQAHQCSCCDFSCRSL